MCENESGYRVDILFPDEFKDMIAEIYYNGEFLCLLNQDDGFDSISIEIEDNPKTGKWILDLNDFENAVNHAKRRLWELRRSNE